MNYTPQTHKFVAVLNKKIPEGRVMNALAHATAGLVAAYPDVKAMRFDDYLDANGGKHRSISDNPFIVLRADNSNKLRSLRQELLAADICFTDFTSTMTEGTYVEQRARTKQTQEEDLEYFVIVMFGEIEKVSPLTKKFSLWR